MDVETTEPSAGTDLFAAIPILGQMGITLVESGEGRASVSMPAEPNVNHFGVIYAGSLLSAAECLGGVIGFATWPLAGYVPLVKRIEITFLRPALGTVVASACLAEGDAERVRTEALERGKSDFVLEATLTDSSGEVVATTRGVYQLRRM